MKTITIEIEVEQARNILDTLEEIDDIFSRLDITDSLNLKRLKELQVSIGDALLKNDDSWTASYLPEHF